MAFAPIVGSLGYVLSEDRRAVLMIHRNARPDDDAYGKYNGLGGKMEPDEDVATCMTREIFEEAGITVTSMTMRGTVSWPGFGKDGEGWLGFVFLISRWRGTPLTENAEGALSWVPVADVLAGKLPMWEGDKRWIAMVFDGDPRPFHGLQPYDGLTLLADRWSVSRW